MVEKSELEFSSLHNPTFQVLKWKRFPEKLDFNAPKQSLICGPKGQGKSALIECLTTVQMTDGGSSKILDIFSARDCEGLTWCRHKKYRDSVLFLRGSGTTLASEYDDEDINKVTLKKLQEYQTIISVPRFYRSPDEEWTGLSHLLKVLWDRPCWKPKDLWTINIREGINLGTSRLTLGDTQHDAKNQLVYALNQFRHCGYPVNMDTLRLKSIDINIRDICDYIFLKKQGIFMLPDELRFVYRPYDLVRDVMRIKPYGFIVVTTNGGVGHGSFQKPYWHKETFEDIVEILGIEIKFEDFPQEGKGLAIGDLGHARMVELRLTKNKRGKQLSMRDIAVNPEVKCTVGTVKFQLDKHNEAVNSCGECPKCARAKRDFSKVNTNGSLPLEGEGGESEE